MKPRILSHCLAALLLAAALCPEARGQNARQTITITSAELRVLTSPVTSTIQIQAASEGGYVRFRPAGGGVVERNTSSGTIKVPLDVLPDLHCILNPLYNPGRPVVYISDGRVRMQFQLVPRRPEQVEVHTFWNPPEDRWYIPDPPGIEVSTVNVELSFVLTRQGNVVSADGMQVRVDGDWSIRDASNPIARTSGSSSMRLSRRPPAKPFRRRGMSSGPRSARG